MPVKLLNTGPLVYYDEEDADLLDSRSWHTQVHFPSGRPYVVASERRHNRTFKVKLSRMVALRMRPDLLTRKLRFKATPKNGDYLDCRRENIEIKIILASRRGRKGLDPRAKGWQREPVKRPRLNQPEGSPVWAGGYEVKRVYRYYKGEGDRVRRCIQGKPVD